MATVLNFPFFSMHSLISVFACIHFTNNNTWANFSTTWNYAYPNLENTCGEKFLQVLIFAIFAVFPAIRKNKFPRIKIVEHTFPAKINSRLKIQYYEIVSVQSQLVSFIQKQRNSGLLLENMYFYCTYSTQ